MERKNHLSQKPLTKADLSASLDFSPQAVFRALEMNNKSAPSASSFDDRFVDYNSIHGIEEKDWKTLIETISPLPTDTILEACCGYGDVTKHILSAVSENSPEKITLMDNSTAQLSRAQILLGSNPLLVFQNASLTHIPLPTASQNKVVVKMGIHELNTEDQKIAFQEIYRVLKPGGTFIMWDLSLYPETSEFWNTIIRKKDELCGFESLVKNRHFLNEQEIFSLFEKSNFSTIKKVHNMTPRLHMRNRYVEMISQAITQDKKYSDLLKKIRINKSLDTTTLPIELQHLAESRLEALMQFTREELQRIKNHDKTLSTNIIRLMQIEDTGEDICFTQNKGIFIGTKQT